MAVKKATSKIVDSQVIALHNPRAAFENAKQLLASHIATIEPEERIDYARSFTYAIVANYWEFIYESTQYYEIPPLADLNGAAADKFSIELSISLGKAASKLDFIDASFQIGSIYTFLLPQDYRSTNGIYFTPPALTYRMMAMVESAGLDWTTAKILDPACGGGAFLAPIALKIASAFKTLEPESFLSHIETHLQGFEVDSFSAWLSQVFIEVALNKICKIKRRRLKPVIKVCDTLKLKETFKFDLIIGNPPYGKIKLTAAERQKYRNSLYGHANLYGLFTQFALTNINEKGIIAFVTPTSFLSGEYFKNLRSLICQKTQPIEFDFVVCRKGIFEDVLQETMLSIYKHAANKQNCPVKVNELQTDTANKINVIGIGKYKLPEQSSCPWLLPRTSELSPLMSNINSFTERLADWGYAVKTGPLVWNRLKDQLSSVKSKNSYPLIWAEAITNDGKFIWRANKKNHTLYFKARPKDKWLLVNYPCILLQRTTAKEQNRRLITAILSQQFLDLHANVVIENHINIIKPIIENPKVSLKTLNAFLNSKATDSIFRCINGSVAVSAYELEQLPLPHHSRLSTLELLVEKNEDAEAVEKECYNLYTSKE
jgi:adenine-specific DNA-methyltransferase